MEPRFYDDVVHIKKDHQSGSRADIFCFNYGVVVFWNCSEEEEQTFLEELQAFETSPLACRLWEASRFVYGDEAIIKEEEDEIVLPTDDDVLEESFLKLSMSHALSQSVKLDFFEDSVAVTIEENRHLASELAEKGKISLSRKKISQKVGALFAQKNYINLYSDILDMPEFFWRRPRYEQYYVMASQYLDIETRLGILNRRLEILHEMYDVLSNELKHSHSSFLELIIILLIVSEVIMVFLKDFAKLI